MRIDKETYIRLGLLCRDYHCILEHFRGFMDVENQHKRLGECISSMVLVRNAGLANSMPSFRF